jgi:putative addiction module killer protein
MMIEIRRYVTETGRDVLGEWLAKLKDIRARAKIAVRIDRLAAGNFGDCKPLGRDLHELRIDSIAAWVIGSIIRGSAGHAFCSCAAGIKAGNPRI